MTTLLILFASLVASLLLTAMFLRIGARWVGAAKPYYGRAVIATLVIGMTNLLILLGTLGFESLAPRNALGIELACLLVQGLVASLVIRAIMRTTFARAILVWLASIVGAITALILLFLIVKTYALEAFVVPTNNMAPTVVGWHTKTACPHCQGVLIMPRASPEDREQFVVQETTVGICTSCMQTSDIKRPDGTLQTPDRIAVNKLLAPRRWDVIAFRFPPEPSVIYIMRLVGLPGETVFIKDGLIWVNDVKMDPPEPLSALRYSTELEGLQARLGTPENPWRLGHDEYCVLGDFSKRSADSRFWGHVPGSHIEGVVSLCYWPVSRWKIFR